MYQLPANHRVFMESLPIVLILSMFPRYWLNIDDKFGTFHTKKTCKLNKNTDPILIFFELFSLGNTIDKFKSSLTCEITKSNDIRIKRGYMIECR